MQMRFARELWRVARKGVFVTTPNRWFPVEFHTVLPLLHWLPPPLFRKTLMALGREFFADEQNLNLLSSTGLMHSAAGAGLSDFSISSVSLFGWPTIFLYSPDDIRDGNCLTSGGSMTFGGSRSSMVFGPFVGGPQRSR